jgi:hypothetical protein
VVVGGVVVVVVVVVVGIIGVVSAVEEAPGRTMATGQPSQVRCQ